MTRRPTIVVAVHDGFYGCGTGAGYANFGFLEAVVSLISPVVRLVVMPVRLAPSGWEYQRAWHARAQQLLANAEILPVGNGTGGFDRWGLLENFKQASAAAANRIRAEVLPQAGPLLIVAFDVPFFGLPALLPPDTRARTVLVPRSSGLIHAPWDSRRLSWEQNALHSGLASGTRIGAISRFMGDHLHHDYGIPRESLVPIPDGLSHSDWESLNRDTEKAPMPAEFLLAMGRAQPYKGFDDLLDALTILRDAGTPLPHLVLAATGESPHRSAYQRALAARVRGAGLDATVLTRFTPQVATLLGHPGLRGVVVPSRAEPFGRIPMEAFAAGAAPVITTTADGLAGQVIDGRTGFTCPPGAPHRLANALALALRTTHHQRVRMRERARQHALRSYDHPGAVRDFLATTAPWLVQPGADDRLRWLSSSAPSILAGSSVSTVSPVKVPIGLQAQHWNTIEPERVVLVVAHHVTSLLRLLDVITVFDSDPRVQVVFSCAGSDPFQHGLHPFLDRLGVIAIPWSQAIDTEFDLVIAANHGGLIETIGPRVILSHGAGYSKNSPGNRKPETGNRKPETGNRSVFGLSPEWLMYNGQPIADSLVLSHDSELSRLASATPEAAHIGVVAGDPCFDRMLRSEHLREGYRRELGVQPGQQLVTITTTWSPRSLMGSWPSLFREVLACLPTDEYRVAAVIHPNIWHGHGPWQVHTWLADCVRAGLILLPPTEGWQAILIASDLVLGDYGATTCYAAGLAKPTLLAAFPDEAVAPGSVAASLGRTAPSLDRHASLRTQIDRTIREHTPSHTVRDALTSCPGEAAARLRTLFYEYLRLPELAADALVPVIPPTSVTTLPRAAATADHVVCTLNEAGDVATITRYPADVTTSTSDDGHLDAARLAVHEDHPRRQLLDEAAIIIAPSLHADGIWRDHPGADVVVSPSAADWVVSMRDGARIVLRADDPAAAASVVHEWLVTGRSFANWPEQVTIVAGPRTTTALTLSVALA